MATFCISDEQRLKRILVLGSEGNSLQTKLEALSSTARSVIKTLLSEGKGMMMVNMVTEMSTAGRVAKMDPLIFTLALCMGAEDLAVRRAAHEAVQKVCGTPTHLFLLLQHAKTLASQGKTQSWGRMKRRAVADWYKSRSGSVVALQVTKYPSRNNWTHRDALRLCHMQPSTVAHDLVAAYAIAGIHEARAKFIAAVPHGLQMVAEMRETATKNISEKRKRAREEHEARKAKASAPASASAPAPAPKPKPPTLSYAAAAAPEHRPAPAPAAAAAAAAAEQPAVVADAVKADDDTRKISDEEQARQMTIAVAHLVGGLSLEEATATVSSAQGRAFVMATAIVDLAKRLRQLEVGMVDTASASDTVADNDEDGATADQGGFSNEIKETIRIMAYLEAIAAAKEATQDQHVADLIEEFRLVREQIPTNFLNSATVWMALLRHMPPLAMIRNLGKMSSVGGVLDPDSEGEKLVVDKLSNFEAMRRARVHPIQLLLAYRQYCAGRGLLGSNSWSVNPYIVNTLEDAFTASFRNVEPTGKRILIGLDVSGSMDSAMIPGTCITAREASVAMVLVALRSEPDVQVVSFQHTLVPLAIQRDSTLDQAMKSVRGLPFGATNCAAPMKYALDHSLKVDTFIIYTDSETNTGGSPAKTLHRYREASGIADAKLIVVAMVSSYTTIADPSDPNMLDVVGFDSNTPQVMSEFMTGRL